MKILAIDTSSSFLSVALWRNGEVFSYHKLCAQNQASLIYSAINKVLKDANLKLCSCDAIAFGKGPGSFTGVRIAAACVQGLAIGCDLPVIPISNLQALAKQTLSASQVLAKKLADNNSILVLTGVDARMAEVYASWHKINLTSLLSSSKETLINPSRLKFLNEPEEFIFIGNADIYLEQMPVALKNKIIEKIHTQVNAIDIAHLATKVFIKNGGYAPSQAQPVYLRAALV